MKRKALIIYCTKTQSDPLPYVAIDAQLLRDFLMSNLGGGWVKDEIILLENPKIEDLKYYIESCFRSVDYSFVVFTGHGCIDYGTKRQVLEIADGNISLADLVTSAARQTLIIDACRGYENLCEAQTNKCLCFSEFISLESTRQIFDNHVMNAEEGLTILFSSSVNQSSTGSDIYGSYYIYSLIEACKEFGKNEDLNGGFDLKEAHNEACKYLKTKFAGLTTQKPVMNTEKRKRYFPLAVKHTSLTRSLSCYSRS